MRISTYGKMQAIIKRHVRPAKDLLDFDSKELIKAFDYCQKKYIDDAPTGREVDWTLETVLKALTSRSFSSDE